MSATQATARNITAPEELGLETRLAFREVVTRELAEMPDGGILILDMTRTVKVDSAGLSVIMLIQRQADDRSQRVVLSKPPVVLSCLLAMTQLSFLFVHDTLKPL